MVAGRLEPVRQAGEQAAVGMVDAAELAVHRPRRAHDLAAERLPDRLMTETDAEDRPPAGGLADQVQADAGLVRITWSRRDDDALGLPRQRLTPRQRHLAQIGRATCRERVSV